VKLSLLRCGFHSLRLDCPHLLPFLFGGTLREPNAQVIYRILCMCIYVCMYPCMYVCYVCMYMCICICIYVLLGSILAVARAIKQLRKAEISHANNLDGPFPVNIVPAESKHVCMYVCVFLCICVCMHICMYVCMYVCMYRPLLQLLSWRR